MRWNSLRQQIGAAVYDWPRYVTHLRRGHGSAAAPWTAIRNRNEVFSFDATRPGLRCEWQWTSDLHIAQVFPSTGVRLMRTALADWPISFRDAPAGTSEPPRVSFLIGHRGDERLPLLLLTLKSIAAQTGVPIECVVVEQDSESRIADQLPPWVRYLFTKTPSSDFPYSRSWTLNAGANEARGELLVLHDNDMLVPERYASELLARRETGADFLDLKRFTFYLTAEHTARIVAAQMLLLDAPPDAVVQNLQGASLAASRDAYFAIGGFDEEFVGWGGEDNDFRDRAATLRVDAFGYLPMLHLWHAPQKEKASRESAPAIRRYEQLSATSPEERIRALRSRHRSGPEIREDRNSVAPDAPESR